jgi:hypothetical protein
MPTLTPDASSACTRIAELKSQRPRRANLRRINRFPGSRDYLAAARGSAVECLIDIDPSQPPLRIGQCMRVMIGPVPE